MITVERIVKAFDKIKLRPCRHQFTRSVDGRLVSCCGLTAIMLADGVTKDQIGAYMLRSSLLSEIMKHTHESPAYVEGFMSGWDDNFANWELKKGETEFMNGFMNGFTDGRIACHTIT